MTRQEREFDGPPPGDPTANQVAQAERVVAKNRDFRYAPGLGWLHWNELQWEAESDTAFKQAVIRNAQARVAANPKDPFSAQLASRRGIEDVATIAATLPEAAVKVSQLDTYLDYLHAAGITYDMRTHNAWPTKPEELNTRALEWDPAEGCPEWEAMLERCFPDEPDMIAYLQRLVGYGITGYTKEQIFVLMHGKGANGKSTFMDTLAYVFGPYVQTIPVEILMNTKQRDGEAPAPQLAKMRGARIVLTAESALGGHLNEPMIKLLTGDEPITARTLYRDPITFRPEALIMMATNNRPEIRGTDDGIWRRVKLIEWNQSFIGRRDTGILGRLKAEAPGIVNWALDGARDWYAHGLQTPDRVTLSTDNYRSDADYFGTFVPDWLSADVEAWLPRSEVAAVWEEFAAANGDKQLRNIGTLYKALEERGFASGTRRGVRGFYARRTSK